MNKKPNIDWYSLDKILKHDAQYYIIFGERSNGKSYAVDKYMIDRYFLHGEEFALVKRYEEDIKGKYMSNLFDGSLVQYILDTYHHHLKFYQGKWYVYHEESEGKLADCQIFGYAFSLANVNRTKATTYPNVTTILYEEFMSIRSDDYLNDELNLLLNLVSTIVRFRHNVKIFMLANAISKYNPYFSALGIKAHRLKKGEITLKEYTNEKGFKTKFAIERSKNVDVFDNKENINKVVYNNFGNSGVGKMITTGEFETHSYPRRVGNVCFDECRTDSKDVIIGKKHKTKFVIKFEDYFYRIYLASNGKYVLGFREVEENEVTKNNTNFIINGDDSIFGTVSITNLASFNDIRINRMLNIFVACMKQRDFVTICDDDGENVINGFRLSGIPL